jgi:hypothetical protein
VACLRFLALTGWRSDEALALAGRISTSRAGGLGKPVWLLSRFDGCWCWLRGRKDSPWYPTIRLYRQPHQGDWAPVFSALTADLATFAGQAPDVTARAA